MKNNQKLLPLNIQLFAEKGEESMASSTETEQVAENTTQKSSVEETQKEKTYSRSEVNKMLNAEKEKIKQELLQEFKNEKSEAEKLAKMDAEQKLNYELEQKTKENEKLQSQLNAMTLKSQANSYANEKGLPIGYIEDWDFAKETADSVKEKIDKLTNLRSNDLNGYLKDKLKQQPPKAVDTKTSPEDPYIKGFKNYFKANK